MSELICSELLLLFSFPVISYIQRNTCHEADQENNKRAFFHKARVKIDTCEF